MSLYTMTQEQKNLLAQFDANTDPETGELSPDYAAALDAQELSIAAKVEAVEAYRRDLRGDVAKFKAEEAAMAAKRKALERKDESLFRYIETCLNGAGLDQLKAGLFDLKFAATPASVLIADEAAIADIPPRFLRYKEPEIDKVKVKDALKAGEVLEFATLQTGRVLRIK